jgi:Mg-chelatase subunit ChlI
MPCPRFWGKIVTGCTTIQTGTMEIAAAANDLAMRSEQQASSIAETARTLNEFTGTVRITADNARQTSSRLAVARATADTVEDIAHKAVEAMRLDRSVLAKCPKSSASSTASRSRPTCWRSTPGSKPPAPGIRARALPSSQ